MITKNELLKTAKALSLSPQVIEKDYVLGWLIAGIYQHKLLSDKWIFKGGTCLKKCYFETYRFSEDLDYTFIDPTHLNDVFLQKTFKEIATWIYEKSGIEFPLDKISFEIFNNPKNKMMCQGKIFYRGPIAPTSANRMPRIKFDLTADEIVVDKPVKNLVNHPYSDMPKEGIHALCYSYVEIFAEKIRALGERTRPRDLYDVISVFERAELVKSAEISAQVKSILLEKCRYKNISVPGLKEVEIRRAECEAGWEVQLAHQIRELPEFEVFWGKLGEFFEWLNN